jgi:SAM-dependent methyltransferase
LRADGLVQFNLQKLPIRVMSTLGYELGCGADGCGIAEGAPVKDAGMDFIRCPTCRVLRIPPKNLINSNVPPDPAGKLSLTMRLLLSLRMLWLQREVPQLRDKHARIMDIGCGDGQFLEFLSRRGYDRIAGIEPNPDRAHNARRRGVPVFATRQEAQANGQFADGFDVMFLWHVLEHVDRPANFLADYLPGLAGSGVLVISVPNQEGMQTRLFGYFSAFPDYGRHVWYHTSYYLNWFAKVFSDMTPSLMRDRNIEYEVFSWVDSAASALLRQQNFVHRALKKGEGPVLRRIAAALAAVCLLPVAMVLTPISLCSGAGSTLTFVLRRRIGRDDKSAARPAEHRLATAP